MKKIAVYGAGGHAREVLQIILDIQESQPEVSFEGFVVDQKYITQPTLHNYPIFSAESWVGNNVEIGLVVALGDSAVRSSIVAKLESKGHCNFETLIHPSSQLGRNVAIGPGSIIFPGTLITTDIRIGRHVHVNMGSTVAHDAVLHDFVSLYPSTTISGNVEIGRGCEIGAASVILPGKSIGEWAVVGAGAVVNRNIPNNTVAVGVPARAIKIRNGECPSSCT